MTRSRKSEIIGCGERDGWREDARHDLSCGQAGPSSPYVTTTCHSSPPFRVVQKVVEAHRGKIDPHFFRSEDHKDKVKKLLGQYIEQYKKK